MSLHGVKVKVGGFGQDLKISYFSTSRCMTVLAHFMYKKNVIRGHQVNVMCL